MPSSFIALLLDACQLELVGKVACGEMIVLHFTKRRNVQLADILCVATACMERAARRRIRRIRHVARQYDALLVLAR